jgi:hypothetical protein
MRRGLQQQQQRNFFTSGLGLSAGVCKLKKCQLQIWRAGLFPGFRQQN